MSINDQLPMKVRVALHSLSHCREVKCGRAMDFEPQTRKLEPMELGLEIAALNLLRNYLNGEIELDPNGSVDRPRTQGDGAGRPFSTAGEEGISF